LSGKKQSLYIDSYCYKIEIQEGRGDTIPKVSFGFGGVGYKHPSTLHIKSTDPKKLYKKFLEKSENILMGYYL